MLGLPANSKLPLSLPKCSTISGLVIWGSTLHASVSMNNLQGMDMSTLGQDHVDYELPMKISLELELHRLYMRNGGLTPGTMETKNDCTKGVLTKHYAFLKILYTPKNRVFENL